MKASLRFLYQKEVLPLYKRVSAKLSRHNQLMAGLLAWNRNSLSIVPLPKAYWVYLLASA